MAAGIEQANNTFRDYGQGASGYAKRFGAKFADWPHERFLQPRRVPSIFHQDLVFLSGIRIFQVSIAHAVGSAFVTRSDSGHTMPNYSYLLGDMCSGALSNLYYPSADRGPGLVSQTPPSVSRGALAPTFFVSFSRSMSHQMCQVMENRESRRMSKSGSAARTNERRFRRDVDHK